MEGGSNPEYEIFFGCDNGLFYCLSSEYHTALWSYDTSGRVLSSPAICNIDNDDELEVIVGSDSGKVYCFDGDPSDGVDEGQNIPGDSSTRDILWIYDAGTPIGISSPVVADINDDGQLEVVIGDTAGSIHCISAGGTSVGSQSDWPKFRFDLNNTGFYKPEVFLPHIITPNDPTALEDEFYQVDYDAVNAEFANGYTWSMKTNATWLNFIPATAVISGTPGNSNVGTYWVDIKVDNGTYSDGRNFTLAVINVNDDPTIDILDKETAIEDELYYNEYQGSDIDPTNDVLSWSFTSNATFLGMIGNNLSGTPLNEHVGDWWVLINLSDNKGGYAESNFTLSVQNANDPPSILGDDLLEVYEDSEYVNDYDVSDMDVGDTSFTWTVDSNCSFLGIDTDGNLTGLPLNDDVGKWWVNVTVEDGFNGMDSHNFTLTVHNVNDWPYWENVPPDEEIGIIDTYYFDVNASDVDKGDKIAYAISSTTISSMEIDKDTGELNWVPDRVGIFEFNISATDTQEIIYWDFSLNVTSVNSPPTVTLKSPANGSELDVVNPTFEWSSTDLDEDTVTCDLYVSTTLSNVETLTTGSRIGEGIENTSFASATNLDRGATYYWTVIPHDGTDQGTCTSDVWSFSIKESAVVQNTPPAFTSSPTTTAKVGEEWSYTPSATDDDGDDITIEFISGPEGMEFIGGELVWTPTSAQVGTLSVRLSVTDGTETVYQDFDITVTSDIVDDDDEDDDTGTSLWALWIIIPIILVVIIIIVIVAVIMLKRKKKEEEEEMLPEPTEGALDAEVESDDIFKQKEGAAYAGAQAQAEQPMDQGAYPEEQYAQMDQPEGGVGMPEAEAVPQVDTPAPEQLPPATDADVAAMPEDAGPEVEDAPDMEDPYTADIEVGDDHTIRQLNQGEDEGV
jgi:hypothetical protein